MFDVIRNTRDWDLIELQYETEKALACTKNCAIIRGRGRQPYVHLPSPFTFSEEFAQVERLWAGDHLELILNYATN